MKFIVHSTSGGWKEKPCEEAVRDSIITEYQVGKEIIRNPKDVWSIEINTLEELIDFFERNGDIIIKDCFWNRSLREIEIYDDYRE